MRLRHIKLALTYEYDELSGSFGTSLVEPDDYRDRAHYIEVVDAAANSLVDRFVALHNVIHSEEAGFTERVRIPYVQRGGIKSREYQAMCEKAALFDKLVEMMGHVQDGSNETVKMFCDDATMTYHVCSGNNVSGWSGNLSTAIEYCYKEYSREN